MVLFETLCDEVVDGLRSSAHLLDVGGDLVHSGEVLLNQRRDILAGNVVGGNEQLPAEPAEPREGLTVLLLRIHERDTVLLQVSGADYGVRREPHAVPGAERRLRHVVAVQALKIKPRRERVPGKLRAGAGGRGQQPGAHLRGGASSVEGHWDKEAVLHRRRGNPRRADLAAGLLPQERGSGYVVGVGVRQEQLFQLPAMGSYLLQNSCGYVPGACVYHADLPPGITENSYICRGRGVPSILADPDKTIQFTTSSHNYLYFRDVILRAVL